MLVLKEQIRINVRFLKFDIFFLIRNDYQRRLYQQHRKEFRLLCQETSLDMKKLQIISKSKITKFLVRREKSEKIYLLYDRIDANEFEIVCKTLKKQNETMYVVKHFSKNNRILKIIIEIDLLKKINNVSYSLALTHDLKLTSFLKAYY